MRYTRAMSFCHFPIDIHSTSISHRDYRVCEWSDLSSGSRHARTSTKEASHLLPTGSGKKRYTENVSSFRAFRRLCPSYLLQACTVTFSSLSLDVLVLVVMCTGRAISSCRWRCDRCLTKIDSTPSYLRQPACSRTRGRRDRAGEPRRPHEVQGD